MRNKAVKKILTYIVLNATVLSLMWSPLSALNTYAAESHWYNPENEYHEDIDYADMVVEPLDEEGARALLEEFNKSVEAHDEDAVCSLYDELIEMGEHIETVSALNGIRHNRDVFNSEYEEMREEVTSFYIDYTDDMFVAMRDALDSDCGDALKEHIADEYVIEMLAEYYDMSDEEKELYDQYTELTSEYDKLVTGDPYYEINGEKWNFEKLENSAVGYSDYVDIATGLYAAQNKGCADIYIEIIDIKNKIAKYKGYDSYVEYAYEEAYNRDYSYEELTHVQESVKKYAVPLLAKLRGLDTYNYKLENMNLSGEERIAMVADVIPKIDPELEEAWDYLISHGLYDLDAADNKLDTGYTTGLPEYGSAFIFDCPYGDWNDVRTVIHEFGHYNNTYHVQYDFMTDGFNVDVCEIQSQGLELLSLEYAGEIFGEDLADVVRIKMITKMLQAVVDGCMVSEFEYWAFNYEGKLDADTLNDRYGELVGIYYPEESVEELQKYSWAFINHIFESPMYYIGYATSALAALDIFAMSTKDRQAGVDCYMNISTYGWDTGYREVLSDVGLPDIFEEENVEDICIAVEDYVDDTSSVTWAIVLTIAVFFGLIFLIVSVIALITHTRRVKMAREQEQRYREMQIYQNGGEL